MRREKTNKVMTAIEWQPEKRKTEKIGDGWNTASSREIGSNGLGGTNTRPRVEIIEDQLKQRPKFLQSCEVL